LINEEYSNPLVNPQDAKSFRLDPITNSPGKDPPFTARFSRSSTNWLVIKMYTSKQILTVIENRNLPESRRGRRLWIFQKAGEANSKNATINFGSRRIIRLNCLAIN